MRILHTGDWHLGKNLEGQSRMDEQEAFLNDFIDIVEENNIDLVIIAGDVYDSSNPPARAEKMFYDTLKKLSKNGERLTLVIAGNHDNPERLVAAGPLAMEHGIIMVGTPKTVVQPGQYGKHRVVNSGEGFVEIEINGEKSVILTVPYPSEKRLNEVLYGEMDDDDERLKSYGERIKQLFDSLKVNYRKDTINIAVSHIYTMGSEESGSERAIQLGGSYIVDGYCLPKEAQYVALGHVHKPQVVPGTNKKARYSGSPIQYNKKERNTIKKCFIVDLSAGKEAIINEVELKIYKPIELWACNSIDEAIEKCEENKERECWVYLEIKTDRYIREDEIKRMKDLKKDILEILPKLNSDVEEESAISIQEKSFEEIFREFYKKEREVEADNEVVDLLLRLLNEEGDDSETN
ncbi:exonuclease SbcCD subunit D [Clostridium celatum]|uniref:Nuclease SbcCD subunit D n=1 Tax=Clostridium celatum DSM 1785 TaxID=545697 RepID=L1QCW5_9CLOT|nr:exonuclease SbcCD subunit D [Clostridium celatum]EKY25808.1 exonuclease SbcCD, D subunit [Clostridium celatum DSM 1785]MCE9653667.1 exonuclease SbcCD subunit D [Clostridium celatum]